MCNLYKVKSSHTEVADFFDAIVEDVGANVPEEIYPGYPAMIVAGGKLRSMVWGFPLAQTGAKGQSLKPRPVNNTRTDKVKSYFWRDSFENRRCLIPVSTFAEAEGPKGSMTRTWLSMPDAPLFAAAGIWRTSDEWGAACSMLITDANAQVAPVHNRMPVILRSESWEQWLAGTPSEAYDLCVPFEGELALDRTDEPWFKRRGG